MFLDDFEIYEKNKTDLVVSVVGAGYVGCSLATFFAKSGAKIWLIDIDQKKVDALNSGDVPFFEPSLQESFLQYINKNLFVTSNTSMAISESDVIFVTVGTPLNAFKEPDISSVTKSCEAIAGSLKRGALVILGSTVPVGTTSDIIKPLMERVSSLKVEEEFGLAFCPERLLEGSALENISDFPKIVGAIGERSRKASLSFFDIVGIKTFEVSSPDTAEMAKLLCNAYRAVNIALGNELSMICEPFGINANEVIRASNTSPIVNVMRPGMMGGSCLTKDPDFLTTMALKSGILPKILLATKDINESLPKHVAKLTSDAFKEAGKEIKNSKIAILGFAFKGETDDTRETPVLPLIETLGELSPREISVYDPYVHLSDMENLNIKVADSIESAIRDSDCVIIGAEHNEIRNLDYAELFERLSIKPILIDGKGVLKERIAYPIIQKGIGLS